MNNNKIITFDSYMKKPIEWTKTETFRPKNEWAGFEKKKCKNIFVPPFKASFEKDRSPTAMGWLLSNEYGRIWQQEHEKYIQDKIKSNTRKFIPPYDKEKFAKSVIHKNKEALKKQKTIKEKKEICQKKNNEKIIGKLIKCDNKVKRVASNSSKLSEKRKVTFELEIKEKNDDSVKVAAKVCSCFENPDVKVCTCVKSTKEFSGSGENQQTNVDTKLKDCLSCHTSQKLSATEVKPKVSCGCHTPQKPNASDTKPKVSCNCQVPLKSNGLDLKPKASYNCSSCQKTQQVQPNLKNCECSSCIPNSNVEKTQNSKCGDINVNKCKTICPGFQENPDCCAILEQSNQPRSHGGLGTDSSVPDYVKWYANKFKSSISN